METTAAFNLSIDAPNGAPPPRGTQRRTRHHRRVTTTVSSTSSFRRRRRGRGRLLGSRRRGRQAAGRGSTFGADCAARRAASAPSSNHRPRAQYASVGRCADRGRWPDSRARGSPSASPPVARALHPSRRAAKGARRSMANGEIVVSRSVLRRAWSRPQRGGGAPRARSKGEVVGDGPEHELGVGALRLLALRFVRRHASASRRSLADRW